MLLVELSGEHPALAAAEAEAALEVLGHGRAADRDDDVLVAEGDAEAGRSLAARVALAHAVSAHWFSAPAVAEEVVARLGAVDLRGTTFAVRARRTREHHPDLALSGLERAAGTALAALGRVDLVRPELEVRVVVAARAHVGALLARVDRPAYEARAVKHRPFFSPVSLHPRFARALVNLARVRAGDRVLDPFCGTGGVALEAGLVGARVLASDLDPRMAAGTEDVLRHYGVADAVCEERDVGEAPDFGKGVDAVVTDPPYGRSATRGREAEESLYRRFFAAAHEALRPGGRLAASFHDPSLLALAPDGLVLDATHALRVHASLTRHFAVLRKA